MGAKDFRILVIDDEAAIRNLLRINLENEKFKISEAETGSEGLARAAEHPPHLIILDLGLPDMDGLDVLKSLRTWTKTPVIILTVSDAEDLKVNLLDAGADDYLTKPFGIPELLARVRVALRHHAKVEANPIFISDNLEVDLNLRTVKVSGMAIRLTATEYELLSILVQSHGKVVPQLQLLTQVWGPNAKDQSHYLRIYVGQLRKKIEADYSVPKHILTEPGVGYRLV